MHSYFLSITAFAGLAIAQQVGTNQVETHPALSYSKCTSSGCTSQNAQVVLDSNWRWVHTTSGYTNCYTGNTWDASLCPDGDTCAKNCALEGANYSGTYGITTASNALTLKFKTGSNVGSRVYLLNGEKYEMFKLKNQEFTFDVDVSQLGCGINGALYFVNMDSDGGMARFSANKAGAAYGTGYCDSQCPQDIKFINGKANVAGWKPSNEDPNSGTGNMGTCCPEMDIWEANSISQAVTPHPCSVNQQTVCTSATQCGSGDGNRYSGLCDKDGCDFNPYRWGNHTFYGPGMTLDTKAKITVVTQFVTTDNTATGALTAIRRLYVQNGMVIKQSNTDVSGITTTNEITDKFCTEQKKVTGDTNSFASKGGMSGMDKALSNGMVLVMSIWDDYTAKMRWLDASAYPETADPTKPGIARGTCSTTSGKPSDVEFQQPNAQVVFSNIKVGAIGSTYKAS